MHLFALSVPCKSSSTNSYDQFFSTGTELPHIIGTLIALLGQCRQIANIFVHLCVDPVCCIRVGKSFFHQYPEYLHFCFKHIGVH